jgi:tetratricopeptide (TPR) repeat protein
VNRRLWPVGVLGTLCLLCAASASAQIGVEHAPFGGTPINQPGEPSLYKSQASILFLTVRSENRAPLDRQSVVKLYNKNTKDVFWQTTQDNSQAALSDLVVGQYDIEVSAVGYLTAHKDFNVLSALHTYQEEIVLKPDPSAVELNAANESQMPSKARKKTQRGVTALKSGDMKGAQKQLDVAYKLAPTSPDVNFLLGYMYFQQKNLEQAKSYLGSAAKLDPHNVQALTLLGRVYIQQEDYASARTSLEEAIAAHPGYWMAHKLLADTYLKQHQYEKAREQAQRAIEENEGGGNSAQLVLGESLANLGQDKEAIQTFQNFLQVTPDSPMAPQIRKFIAELQEHEANPAKSTESVPQVTSSLASASSTPGADVDDLRLSIKTWEPAGIDDTKPLIAADVACPSQHVTEMAGERVKQLVDDVSKFAAIEDLLHEQLDELGHPTSHQTRKFNYVVAISETQPGFLAVEEYRNEVTGIADFPDQIGSHGFTSLALVFHPDMRDNFEMTCEGLGDWHGQATWLVHFRQRDDRPNRIHAYKIGPNVYSVNLKGRAWISADTFQIIRVESEMVNPMPKIHLLSEHQIVEYGPIQFQKKNVEMWLPKSADLYFDFRRHRYFRRHSFDHYMLFAVDSDEKQGAPKQQPPSAGSSSLSKATANP